MVALCLAVLPVACTREAQSDGGTTPASSEPPSAEATEAVDLGDAGLPSEIANDDFQSLRITSGGTYEGAFGSADAGRPAVVIATTEPVTITRSVLAGRGDLVVSERAGVDLTVSDSQAYGLNPDEDGVAVGRFVKVERPRRLVVEHNEIVSTAGISVLEWAGNGSPEQTISIIGNRASNIDGRTSNGSGEPGADGYYGEDQVTSKQFVQLDKVQDVPGIEIAWNEIRNRPGESRVEDNISVYLSGGTPDDPIDIHDNLVDGAYPIDPAADDFSGGGIMLGDGIDGPPPSNATASDNVVLNTANYGIAVSAGNNMTFSGNRVLSTGRLPDGTPIASQNVGIYVWNIHGTPEFHDNDASGNVVGWENPTDGGRNDFYFPDLDLDGQNSSFDGTVTNDTIKTERRRWRGRATAAGVVTGVR
jgi:hypothetical protein